MKKLELGVNYCSNEEYHGNLDYLSSSNLKMLLKDREQFYKERILKEKTPNRDASHFDEGSLTHSLILEPEKVQEEYAFFSGMRKQGAEYEKFKEENKGKIIISAAQKIRTDMYYKAYKENPIAKNFIEGGEPEHTICTVLNDVPVKIRCDYLNVDKKFIVDVKTTAFPADHDSFKLTIDKWGYDLSTALYVQVANQFYNCEFDFYFIVIDKKFMQCHVYKASKQLLEKGTKQVAESLRLYKDCLKTGIWTNDKKPEIINEENEEYEILEV